MIETIFLREAITVIGTALAAYTDTKTGLIFDEITYPMIALGILFNLVEQNISGLILAAVVFVIGYALYFGGKIGGGDIKLFFAIALLVPFTGNSVFILNVIFVSGITSIVAMSVYYFLKYAKKGISIQENKKGITRAAILSLALLAYFYFGLSTKLLSTNFALIIGIPLAFSLIFVALEKGIKKNFFLAEVSLSELDEDDLIASEFLDEKTKKEISLKFKGIIDEKLKKRLAELKIAKIAVYRNLPKFAPFILIGVIVSIFFPNALIGALT